MARTTDRKRKTSASSGAALVAVMLASPGLAAAPLDQKTDQTPSSQSSARSAGYEKQMSPTRSFCCIKIRSEFKYKGEFSVAGTDRGHVVFEDERGNLFYVDEATGDQKFVSRDIFMKVGRTEAARTGLLWVKLSNKVTILAGLFSSLILRCLVGGLVTLGGSGGLSPKCHSR